MWASGLGIWSDRPRRRAEPPENCSKSPQRGVRGSAFSRFFFAFRPICSLRTVLSSLWQARTGHDASHSMTEVQALTGVAAGTDRGRRRPRAQTIIFQVVRAIVRTLSLRTGADRECISQCDATLRVSAGTFAMIRLRMVARPAGNGLAGNAPLQSSQPRILSERDKDSKVSSAKPRKNRRRKADPRREPETSGIEGVRPPRDRNVSG